MWGTYLSICYLVLLSAHMLAQTDHIPTIEPTVTELRELLNFDLQIETVEKELGRKISLDEAIKRFPSYGEGCNWYCGGQIRVRKASSTLPPSSKFSYDAGNAHDFNSNTAWVEGVDGDGIGEYIEYWLYGGPPMNAIEILNGYVKNEKAWLANSRVKSLKVSVAGKPVAILALQDRRDLQRFDLRQAVQAEENDSLVLRFEILDVYRGAKYRDTVLSELTFDGTGVHCFIAGTEVQMADGTARPIETISIGDNIISADPASGELYSATVLEMITRKHHNLYRLTFQDREIVVTDDHPFYVAGKGWASIVPSEPEVYVGFSDLIHLATGDNLLMIKGSSELETLQVLHIEKVNECLPTYAITKTSRGSTHFANGVLVGVEEIRLPGKQ